MIRYLSNGKKVVVLEKLNDRESIVQEIFVKNNKEFPSGEKFTVATVSLSDKAIVSYAEKRELEVRSYLAKTEQKQKDADNQLTNTYERIKGVEAVLRNSENIVKSVSPEKLRMLTAFLTGTIEYVVIDKYDTFQPPIKLIDGIMSFERQYYGEVNRFDSLKLISVMGKSDGDLHYRIHQYSDGSGCCGYEVYPFLTKKEALNHIQEKAVRQILDNRLSEDSYIACLNMGIIFSKDVREKQIKDMQDGLTKTIASKKSEIESKNKELEELNKKMKYYSSLK